MQFDTLWERRLHCQHSSKRESCGGQRVVTPLRWGDTQQEIACRFLPYFRGVCGGELHSAGLARRCFKLFCMLLSPSAEGWTSGQRPLSEPPEILRVCPANGGGILRDPQYPRFRGLTAARVLIIGISAATGTCFAVLAGLSISAMAVRSAAFMSPSIVLAAVAICLRWQAF
jgi:hypothetical protein